MIPTCTTQDTLSNAQNKNVREKSLSPFYRFEKLSLKIML